MGLLLCFYSLLGRVQGRQCVSVGAAPAARQQKQVALDPAVWAPLFLWLLLLPFPSFPGVDAGLAGCQWVGVVVMAETVAVRWTTCWYVAVSYTADH